MKSIYVQQDQVPDAICLATSMSYKIQDDEGYLIEEGEMPSNDTSISHSSFVSLQIFFLGLFASDGENTTRLSNPE